MSRASRRNPLGPGTRSTGVLALPLAVSANSVLEPAWPKVDISGVAAVLYPFMTNSSQIQSRAGIFQPLKDAEETQSSLTRAKANYGSV